VVYCAHEQTESVRTHMFDVRQIFIITLLIVQLVISSVKIVASIVVLGLGLSVSAYAADDSTSSAFTLPSGVTILIVERPFKPRIYCADTCHRRACFVEKGASV
jgi:hypothetical protein